MRAASSVTMQTRLAQRVCSVLSSGSIPKELFTCTCLDASRSSNQREAKDCGLRPCASIAANGSRAPQLGATNHETDRRNAHSNSNHVARSRVAPLFDHAFMY